MFTLLENLIFSKKRRDIQTCNVLLGSLFHKRKTYLIAFAK